MLDILFKASIIVGTFLFMEGVAWFTHKYIMHGILWSWHRSHHKVHNHKLERNDLFALVFSIPSISLIVIGYEFQQLSILKSFDIGALNFYIDLYSSVNENVVE
jgi:beta-carotene 3-hydroxylase